MMLDTEVSIAIHEYIRKGFIVYSSMDSDLEAFSHNPTDDSLAALTFQSTALTNYLNQRFLSPQLSFLINENIPGRCFRGSQSFINPRISPLTIKY